jgi:hypothetical protein
MKKPASAACVFAAACATFFASTEVFAQVSTREPNTPASPSQTVSGPPVNLSRDTGSLSGRDDNDQRLRLAPRDYESEFAASNRSSDASNRSSDTRERFSDTRERSATVEMRQRTADRIGDMIAPGFGRSEFSIGEARGRIDYLYAGRCRLKGVGICITIKFH